MDTGQCTPRIHPRPAPGSYEKPGTRNFKIVKGGRQLLITDDLNSEMRGLFSTLSECHLGPEEEIELAFTPYPLGSGPMTIERYQEVNEVSQIPLAHGPSCELYAAITSSQVESPMPADPRNLLISWRMRERSEEEDSLREPACWAQRLTFSEPSLIMANIYPVDESHVCEARFYFHQSRYPGSRAAG